MPKVSEKYFQQKRKEIVDAAYRICVRKSISAVELKDVIAETGMSHGAIYRYFKDLDEIIGAMIVRVNSEDPYIEDVERIFDDTDGRLPPQIISELCQFLYQQMDGSGIDTVKISFYAKVFMINEPERATKIFESIKDCNTSSSSHLICKFAEYVKQQTIKGNLHPKCSVDDLVQYLSASYDGILMNYLLKEHSGEKEAEKTTSHSSKPWLKNLFLALEYTIINLIGFEERENEKGS